MSANKLTMYRNDTTAFTLSAKNIDGTPMDLTTGDLWFTVKSSSRQADNLALIQKSTTTTGIAITDAVGGLFTVTIDNADTTGSYAPQEYMYDIKYVTSGGEPTTLLSDKLLVKADVTNAVV